MGRANNNWGLALFPMQCLQTPCASELAGCLGGYKVEYDSMLFMTMLSCLPLIAKQNDQALKSSDKEPGLTDSLSAWGRFI